MADLPRLDVVIGNNFGHLPMFIGAEKGFFAKHGVDAKMLVVDTGTDMKHSFRLFVISQRQMSPPHRRNIRRSLVFHQAGCVAAGFDSARGACACHLLINVWFDHLRAPIAVVAADEADDGDVVQQAGKDNLFRMTTFQRVGGALQQVGG